VLTGHGRPVPAFTVCGAPAILARVPLRPATPAAAGQRDADGDGLFAEALFFASRHAASLPPASEHNQGPTSRGEATRRAYELRSRWRATPHAAFAGVATARVACPSEPSWLRLSTAHRARTIPSGSWLAGLCDSLLSGPEVITSLRLVTSNLTVRRGDRLEQQWRDRHVTARVTAASEMILQLCAGGASGTEVTDQVRQQWPVSAGVVHTAIAELVRGGFLLTDLLPGDITNDPLGHLAGKLPPGHRLASGIGRLRQLLAAADQYPPGDPARLGLLTAARDVADSICLTSRPLRADIAADAGIVIPACLLDQAAQAATALWLATSQPDVLASWHERFARRYGPGRLVPLLEASDPVLGLGISTHDIEPSEEPGQPPSGPRSQVLAALVAEALTRGASEIVLDDETLARLAGDSSRPVHTAEISVRVIAASWQDLAAGRLRLAVVPPGSMMAGATIGRFAPLLKGHWPGPPASGAATLIAEIVPLAAAPDGGPLAPPTGFACHRIPVGVPCRDGDIDLADLHLVTDGQHLSCWSARHARQVTPVLYSRLAAPLLPPLARFLQLLGRAGAPELSNWSWGAIAAGPFQPRVRHGQVILAPARWVLPPELTRAAGTSRQWNPALDTWRKTALPRLPDLVVTDDGDQRLPLDLDRNEDRELLRRYVHRGLAAVCEPPGGPDAVQAVVTGPGGQHVLELVVPIEPRAVSHRAPAARLLSARTGDQGLFLPGGPWLAVHLCAPRTCQDQILAQLEALSRDLAACTDMCFWLRYHDVASGPHLRLRFHGDPAALNGTVLPELSRWCAGLRRQRLASGFAIEPYDQETERYGGPAAISAAEHVLAADSRLCLAVLTRTADPGLRIAATALSAAAITVVLAGGDPAALPRHHLDRPARQQFEALRAKVRTVGRAKDPAIFPGAILPQHAEDAWTARHTTLTAYRTKLQPAQCPACAGALAHMHANRLLGDATAERIAAALAADLLARQQTASPPPPSSSS
jgi:lantibiotic biosynthesis protein